MSESPASTSFASDAFKKSLGKWVYFKNPVFWGLMNRIQMNWMGVRRKPLQIPFYESPQATN
jgi:hypothetical protein